MYICHIVKQTKWTIIAKILDYDLHIENPIIELTKPVNITVKNVNSFDSLNVLSGNEIKMTITTSGYWEQPKTKTNVTVALFDDIELIAPSNVDVDR